MLAKLVWNNNKTSFLKTKDVRGCSSKSTLNREGGGALFVCSIHLFVVILFDVNSGIQM